MKYTVSPYSIYEYGQRTDDNGQPHQEDALYPPHGEAQSDTQVFVVCDGMGGHEAGEVASDVVSRTVGEFLTEAIGSGNPCTDALIEEAITRAYDALEAACPDNGNPRKPGTTLTVLVLHPDGFTLAHMGDSRIYLFRPGADGASTQILHRTRDHSLVNDLVACGVITPEEALTSPQRNVITRAIQPHQEQRLKPTIYNGDGLQPGDCFYLCSDGMLEQITDKQLCEIFSDRVADTMQRTNMLRQEAVNNSDNHSAYVVRIDTVNGVEGRRIQPAASETPAPVFENLTATASQPATRPKAPSVMGRRPHLGSPHKIRSDRRGARKVQQPNPQSSGLPSWTPWVIGAAVLVVALIIGIYFYLR